MNLENDVDPALMGLTHSKSTGQSMTDSPLPQPVLDMLARLDSCARYERALREIEAFSVDNDDRGALWMGEVARRALPPIETCKICGGRIDAPPSAMVTCTCPQNDASPAERGAHVTDTSERSH